MDVFCFNKKVNNYILCTVIVQNDYCYIFIVPLKARQVNLHCSSYILRNFICGKKEKKVYIELERTSVCDL